jgi:hypothetical protein
VFALDEIYSPVAEPGELALEYAGSRSSDKYSDKNNIQDHEWSLEYGFPNLMVETAGDFSRSPDSNLRMEDTELQTRLQFFEQGEMWLDSGLLTAYHISTQSHQPDAVEAKLLLQKDCGRFTHKANIGFEQQIGSDAHGGPDYVFLWSSRYRYSESLQPGFEIQSDMGQDHTLGQFNQQEHYFGPALYGRLPFTDAIPGSLKYEIAYLFGVSRESSQGAARLLLEYEMHF